MKLPIILIALLIGLGILSSSFFVVYEGEQAIVTEFGKPVGEVRSAGPHFKMPLIQDVHRFQSRILKWDGDPNQITTRDKRYIWVDTTARWRIADPLLFYRTVATEAGAQSRLDDIIDSVVRDGVSGHLLVELVRGSDYINAEGLIDESPEENTPLRGRDEILADILAKARANVPDYGIELLDVQIKRINYVEQVRKRVYERMISERKKVAAQFRSEGEGEKADILGQMQKELKRISSEAYRESAEIRGDADATAAAIYADAYNRDPEFYSFYRSLEAYRNSISDNSKMVLSTDSDFYRYFAKEK